MENSQYNSLTEKLIQNGILSKEDNQVDNIFDIKPDEDFSHSPFKDEEIFVANKNEEIKPKKDNKKRLNNYDLELIQNKNEEKNIKQRSNTLEIIARFLNFKKSMAKRGSAHKFEIFLCNFFPKLYKARLIKEAMAKLTELDIDTKLLADETIPYGEDETRYEDLIKYLSYANELQIRLKKRI